MKEVDSLKGRIRPPCPGQGLYASPSPRKRSQQWLRESVGGIARTAVPSQLREQVQGLNAALQRTSCGLAEIPPACKLGISSVQSLSCVQLFEIPWTVAHQASLSITNSRSLLKLTPIESVMPSYHLILCRPLLLPPSVIPSIRVFSNESVLRIRWPKCWSFSFSISPSIEYSGLISFGMDWLDLLAVQGTLKSLLQHHSSKTSILWCSIFFIVQLSHPYIQHTHL